MIRGLLGTGFGIKTILTDPSLLRIAGCPPTLEVAANSLGLPSMKIATSLVK